MAPRWKMRSRARLMRRWPTEETDLLWIVTVAAIAAGMALREQGLETLAFVWMCLWMIVVVNARSTN